MFNSPIFLTSFALIAFAANSVFARLALGDDQIDAGSFTFIRLFSASLFFLLILFIQSQFNKFSRPTSCRPEKRARGSKLSALYLFFYAVTFSYAYIQLDTATGALVLFATVQVTMLLIGIFKGRELVLAEWLGLLIAIIGFVVLVAPNLNTPSLSAFILMSLSGLCWALYTLAGKESEQPSSDTIFNFLRTLPLLIPLAWFIYDDIHLTQLGILYACLSGVLASALGYLIWYQALTFLRHSSAAVLQLLVPVLAAIAGFLLLDELLSVSFIVASLMILGGILLVIKRPTLTLK